MILPGGGDAKYRAIGALPHPRRGFFQRNPSGAPDYRLHPRLLDVIQPSGI